MSTPMRRWASGRTQAAGSDVEVLQTLIAVEHASVHDYGLAGVHVPDALDELVRRLADVHRLQRDAIAAAIRARGGEPQPPEPVYAPPAAIAPGRAAVDALVAVERRGLEACRTAIVTIREQSVRRLCADLLTQFAVNEAQLMLHRGDDVVAAGAGLSG